ncbi:28566_t:CDS:2, partial [Gigaspora margarita]
MSSEVYNQSKKIIKQIRIDNRGEKTKPLQKLFTRINEAKKIFKEAEDDYNKQLNETFRVACASDDYKIAFEFLQSIQNEDNNFTKSKVINKIGMRLLGSFSCKQDIAQGRELIKKASTLGLTSAITWVNLYDSKSDFGASEIINHDPNDTTKYSSFEISYDTFSRKLFVWNERIFTNDTYQEICKPFSNNINSKNITMYVSEYELIDYLKEQFFIDYAEKKNIKNRDLFDLFVYYMRGKTANFYKPIIESN